MSQPEGHSHGQQGEFARYGTPRRYTTITLRELQFWGRCDCCPDPRYPHKKHQTQTYAQNSSLASTYVYHARPTLVPRHDSEESTSSDDSDVSRTQSSSSIPTTSTANAYNQSNNTTSASSPSAAVSATAMPVRNRTISTATTSTVSSNASRSSTSSSLGWLRRKATNA